MSIIIFTSYLLQNTSTNYVQNLSNTMDLSTSKEHYKLKNKDFAILKLSICSGFWCSKMNNHYSISTIVLFIKAHSPNIWNVKKLKKKKKLNCMIKLKNFWKKKLNNFTQPDTYFSDVIHIYKKWIHLTEEIQKFAICFK